MADDKSHWRVGDVAMASGGYGFAVINEYGAPLVHFTFTTQAEANGAHLLIEEGLAGVIDVHSYIEPGRMN